MKQTFSAIIVVLLLPVAFYAQAIPHSPQPDNASQNTYPEAAQPYGWSRVRALRQGDTIAVTTMSGETYRCAMSAAEDAALSCIYARGHRTQQNYEFTRSDIYEVRRRHPLRDLAILSGVGATLGYLAVLRNEQQNHSSMDGESLAAGATVFGILTPSFALPVVQRSPGNLIYRHPRRVYSETAPEQELPVIPGRGALSA